MCPEHYLEYLALDSILMGYTRADALNFMSPDVFECWFADGTKHSIKLSKLKDRVTELQKMFLEEYLCTDSNSKE